MKNKTHHFINNSSLKDKAAANQEFNTFLASYSNEALVTYLEQELAALQAQEDAITPESAFKLSYTIADYRGRKNTLKRILTFFKKQ